MEWDCQKTIHRWGSFHMLRHGAGRRQGQELANLLQSFIGPLEGWLDQQVDRRLVRTFFLALAAIVRLRHSRSGLLLSELGAHVLSPAQAPAGTKRLSNLLRSPKWRHNLLEKFLWQRADQELTQLEDRDELALAIWDESVLEKPESIALEGVVPGPLQQGGLSQAHQARLLQSAGRTAGIRARPAMAHRDGGRDAGASSPGRHTLVDQPGQIGQPPPCCPSAPQGGRGGWSTSSTGDSPERPGSGN